MDEKEVEGVKTKPRHRRVERRPHPAVVLVPNFGRHENVLGRHTGGSCRGERAADSRFVAINPGRVDVAITRLQRGDHGGLNGVVGHLPHPKTQRGNGNGGRAGAQRDGRDRGAHGVTLDVTSGMPCPHSRGNHLCAFD